MALSQISPEATRKTGEEKGYIPSTGDSAGLGWALSSPTWSPSPWCTAGWGLLQFGVAMCWVRVKQPLPLGLRLPQTHMVALGASGEDQRHLGPESPPGRELLPMRNTHVFKKNF